MKEVDPTTLMCPLCTHKLTPKDTQRGLAVLICPNGLCDVLTVLAALDEGPPGELAVSHIGISELMLNVAANFLYMMDAPEKMVLGVRGLASLSRSTEDQVKAWVDDKRSR